VRWMPLLIIVSGCGSYWDLRKDESLAVDCDSKLNYYVDSDGDGWGEPTSEPEPLCAPDPSNELTASNNRDCDDSLPGITARIGACPIDIAAAGSFVGLVRGDSEYLALDELYRYGEAPVRCERWSGSVDQPDEDGNVGDRGLAMLKDNGELSDVLALLDEGGFLGPLFLGVAYDGGSWAWEDGTPLGGALAFCDNRQPDPLEFYPNLVEGLGDDASVETLESQARLALINDGGWCLGIPGDDDAVDDSRAYAGLLCERPTPATADYQDVPDAGEG